MELPHSCFLSLKINSHCEGFPTMIYMTQQQGLRIRAQFMLLTNFQTRIRPQSGHIEMEMGLRTRGPTYDKSKGEQIAYNVDGTYRESRDSEDNFYKRYVTMNHRCWSACTYCYFHPQNLTIITSTYFVSLLHCAFPIFQQCDGQTSSDIQQSPE